MAKKIILPLAAGIILLSCSVSKVAKGGSQQTPAIVNTPDTKKDTTKKTVKAYKDVISGNAVTDDGLIKVHRVDAHYYFEIADSILGKDILLVNRVSKAADVERPGGGMLGYAGDYIGENVIRFEKGPGTKLFIKRISYVDISKDSSENGMYRSVYNSNFLPRSEEHTSELQSRVDI